MRKASKYWAIFITQLQNAAAYPLDLLSRSLVILIFMWVFFNLWRAAYSSAGVTSISGMTLHDTLWYLMLTETIVLSKPRLAQAIAAQVKDGSIAYLLNKPYSFLLYQAALAMGDSMVRVLFNLGLGGTLVWIMIGAPPDPRGWPMVLLAMFLGWMIDFCIAALIGLSAFVTEEIAAFEWIYNKLLFLLGGMLIPLDFFPDWLQQIARALPFAAAIYGPARLFVAPDIGAFLSLLLTQLGWLAALGIIVTLIFRRGMAWLSINGG